MAGGPRRMSPCGWFLARVVCPGKLGADLADVRHARGLSALVRIARYAEQGDYKFCLASPSPSLVKLLRITALDRKLLGAARSRG